METVFNGIYNGLQLTLPIQIHKELGLGYIVVHESPTGNCQMCSIENFSIVTRLAIEKQRELLKGLYKQCLKPLMLLDVLAYYESKILSLFGPDAIVLEQPYNSTNGSSMIIYLIKTKVIETW
jgi:hypothetical protein